MFSEDSFPEYLYCCYDVVLYSQCDVCLISPFNSLKNFRKHLFSGMNTELFLNAKVLLLFKSVIIAIIKR